MLSTIRAFRRYARPYRRALLLGALCAVCEVLVRLAEPWPLRIIVDRVLHTSATGGNPGNARVLLPLCVAGLLLVVGLAALFDYWSTRLLSAAGLHLANDVRGSVFAHLQRLSLGFHGRQQVGDLSTRVTSDVDRAQDMLVQALAVVGPNVVLMIGMFTLMLTIDPEFAMVALGVTPFLAFAVHRSTIRLKHTSRRARRADGQVAAATTESLGAMELVHAFSLERSQRGRLSGLMRESLDAGLEAVRLQARFSPMIDVTSAISTAVVLWFGARRVIDGKLSLGVLLVFLSYLSSMYKPVKALSKLSTTLAKGGAAAERVRALLDEEPEIVEPPGAPRLPRVGGSITFDNVSFTYGTEDVLVDVSLQIEPGEALALVGPTGAGKSTLASLVPRLIDPRSGAVRLDGHDLRAYHLGSVRAQVAMVLQDCTLLRGTLRDNILVGRPDATGTALNRAVTLALVDEFSSRFPDGLDTRVGERGATLSGGQRQRIAIARAILRDAPILVLDEPTSALDATSEELLMAALANLPSGRTTLLIAHRLTTVGRADRVAGMESGRIVQLGTPQELAATDGLFRRLVEASMTTAPLAERLHTPKLRTDRSDRPDRHHRGPASTRFPIINQSRQEEA
jgi:ATP-binding cassette, subfamily B, bacterial